MSESTTEESSASEPAITANITHYDGSVQKVLPDGTVVLSSYVNEDLGEKLFSGIKDEEELAAQSEAPAGEEAAPAEEAPTDDSGSEEVATEENTAPDAEPAPADSPPAPADSPPSPSGFEPAPVPDES